MFCFSCHLFLVYLKLCCCFLFSIIRSPPLLFFFVSFLCYHLCHCHCSCLSLILFFLLLLYSPSHTLPTYIWCLLRRSLRTFIFSGLPHAVAAVVFVFSSRVMVPVVLSSVFLHNHPRWGFSLPLSFLPAFVALVLLLLPSFFWVVPRPIISILLLFPLLLLLCFSREKFYFFLHTCSDLSFWRFSAHSLSSSTSGQRKRSFK